MQLKLLRYLQKSPTNAKGSKVEGCIEEYTHMLYFETYIEKDRIGETQKLLPQSNRGPSFVGLVGGGLPGKNNESAVLEVEKTARNVGRECRVSAGENNHLPNTVVFSLQCLCCLGDDWLQFDLTAGVRHVFAQGMFNLLDDKLLHVLGHINFEILDRGRHLGGSACDGGFLRLLTSGQERVNRLFIRHAPID